MTPQPITIPETSLGICPVCGIELITRRDVVDEVEGDEVMGYVYPIHFEPMSQYNDLCSGGGKPVAPNQYGGQT